MSAPIKCWMKTSRGEEGEVILDPRLARYLEFGSLAFGEGMGWPQEEDEEDPVFQSVVFHYEGGITADGDEVVEHRGVPDWAFYGGMPEEGGEA